MKSLIKNILVLLLASSFFGCYTVWVVDNATAETENNSSTVAPATEEYISVYFPAPVPEPQPPQYTPPVSSSSVDPATTSSDSNRRRLTQTGRGPENSISMANQNNSNTRDTGAKRH